MGTQIATAAGLVICGAIYLCRDFLADQFSPGGPDSSVHVEVLESVPVVALYYFLNSMVWVVRLSLYVYTHLPNIYATGN
jgi:hypothetical protein